MAVIYIGLSICVSRTLTFNLIFFYFFIFATLIPFYVKLMSSQVRVISWMTIRGQWMCRY